MPKTGLKTFVYSFSVSLFAIFAANGMYWHEHASQSSDIKIPSKNITLFLKSEATSPSHSVAPVKKIALSVLPEIKQNLSLSKDEDEIIMAGDFDLPEIPLEFSIPSLELPSKETKPIKVAENAAPKPKLIRQEAEEVKQPDKIVIPLEIPESRGIGRPKKADKSNLPEASQISEKNFHSSPSKQNSPKPLLATNSLEAEETLKAPTQLIALQQEEELPLLPLEKSFDGTARNRNIVKVDTQAGVNQVALADKSIPIHSMEKTAPNSSSPKTDTPSPSWESMSDKKVDGSPWLVAKADGALKNQKMSEEAFYQKTNGDIKEALNPNISSAPGVKVASETVKNLLIPIPEDILNDENLTPQLSYSPKETPQKEAASQEPVATTSTPQPSMSAPASQPLPANAEEGAGAPKSKLLASLDAIFSKAPQKEIVQPKEEDKNPSTRNKKTSQKKGAMGKIMPTEMRLSFQPNRAEISGQTLRWIQAFATKAAENNNMTIEIRIDGTSAMELQQKRLNLLHNILTDKGVEYSKINTVFTQREPNSFIIKTITHNNQKGANGNLNKAANGYYIQW